MKAGFTSTSLRSCSIEQVVSAAAKCGSEAIEWGTDYHIKTIEDASSARKLCNENGIEIRSLGTYYRIGKNDMGEWEHLCKLAREAGAGYLRTWLGTRGSASTDETAYTSIIRETDVMADIADKYDVKISNECHPNTYNDTTASSLRYLRDTNGRVKTYYQSWYRDRSGDFEKLEKLLPYVSDVHVSFSELKKFQIFRQKDTAFIPDIINRLAEKDFNGFVFIEFTRGGKPENLINDVITLKNLISVSK